ncbi:type ISP restriction/modification enzyme [Streptomyces sp. NPDC057239]|uniref:type ISP restriction/modification enzyme n=1 Tax=Streptomyces sp. NPDC057239 TaxID=3346061 RepID=UPI00364352E9
MGTTVGRRHRALLPASHTPLITRSATSHPLVLQHRWARLSGEQSPETKVLLFKETGDRRLDARVTCLPGFPRSDRAVSGEAGTRPPLLHIALRSFDRQWLITDNRVLDRLRLDLWEALRPGQVFLNQQSSHAIDNGPVLVATALSPDTHHADGRAEGRTPSPTRTAASTCPDRSHVVHPRQAPGPAPSANSRAIHQY